MDLKPKRKVRKFTAKLVRTNKSVSGDRTGAWAIKLNDLTVAKSHRCRPPRWILRLYRDIEGFHYDVSENEVKKYIGQFMRRGFSKRSQSKAVKYGSIY